MSVALRFLNVSHHACILYGFPGVDGLDSHGRTVVHAKRTYDGFMGGCSCSSLHGVRLRPGQTASAVVEGDNGGAGPPRCSRVTSLLVTPPNTYRSTPVRRAIHNCDFEVHPVVAGTTGQG